MAHWSERYIGIPHAELDCAELSERALREQFGREIRFPHKQRGDLFHRAGLITRHCEEFAYRIDVPHDGCGVLMFARGRMAHMGLYCDIGPGYVLHSDSAFGESVCVPVSRIEQLYRIEGFYGWID